MTKQPIWIELPTDFAVGSVNAYLFVDPEPILVDTGIKSEASRNALITALGNHGLTLRDLSQVVITHPHVDHFGQAAAIASESDAAVLVSELGASWLVDFPTMWRQRIDYYREHLMQAVGFSQETIDVIINYMAGIVSVCDPVPAERVTVFALGQNLMMGGAEWQVYHMPGHAYHQTCFYQSQSGKFISADMLLSKAPTPIVERPENGTDRVPSLPQFLESLAVVDSLEISTVYPGHGRPFGNHRQVIRRQRQRIEARKAECLQLIAEGLKTVADLVDRMYAHLPIQFRFAGLWMLIGYLDLLKAEGVIREQEIDGVWYYSRSDK